VKRVLCLALVIVCLSGCRTQVPAPPAEVRADDVSLTFRDGEARAVLLTPPQVRGAVLVLHGDYGLDDHVRKYARKLADDGYLVLAPDLYDGKVAKDVEEAHVLSRALPDERVKAALQAAVDRLASGRAERVGVVGWDLGGGYALDLAIDDPRVAACVTCYGTLRTDPQQLRKMKASVLGVFGGKDEGITPEIRRDFAAAMKEAGRDLAGLHVYDECDGGFMTPGPDRKTLPADEAAAEAAWGRVAVFLREKLGP
jgi:carboxymethylenebutenolidase